MSDSVERRAREIREERARKAAKEEQWAQAVAEGAARFRALFLEKFGLQSDYAIVVEGAGPNCHQASFYARRGDYLRRVTAVEFAAVEGAGIRTGNRQLQFQVREVMPGRPLLSDSQPVDVVAAADLAVRHTIEKMARIIADGEVLVDPVDAQTELEKRFAESERQRGRTDFFSYLGSLFVFLVCAAIFRIYIFPWMRGFFE